MEALSGPGLCPVGHVNQKTANKTNEPVNRGPSNYIFNVINSFSDNVKHVVYYFVLCILSYFVFVSF